MAKRITISSKAKKAEELFVSVPMAQAIRNELLFLLSVNKGERPIAKTFGSELYKFMFNRINLNTKNSIENHVKTLLAAWAESISNTEVKVQDDPSDHRALLVSINYTINETSEKQALSVPIRITGDING